MCSMRGCRIGYKYSKFIWLIISVLIGDKTRDVLMHEGVMKAVYGSSEEKEKEMGIVCLGK